jgi:hypothetical protein
MRCLLNIFQHYGPTPPFTLTSGREHSHKDTKLVEELLLGFLVGVVTKELSLGLLAGAIAETRTLSLRKDLGK